MFILHLTVKLKLEQSAYVPELFFNFQLTNRQLRRCFK